MRRMARQHFVRGCIVLIGVAVLGASCQSGEQGYWTKPGMSQAVTNQQYPADSEQCERIAEQDEGKTSDSVRRLRYTKCMYARGYEWVSEQSRSHAAKPARLESPAPLPCPGGRLIVDAFGYPKCVPPGQKDRGPDKEVRGSISADSPQRQTQPSVPPPAPRSDDRWITQDRECRRQAQDTLSSPYGVYTQCMQQRGAP
jgi:hypothetical protein